MDAVIKYPSELKAMEIVTLQAHFDGKQILLDEPYELAPNTKLIVSVIQMQDEEREDSTRSKTRTSSTKSN